MGFNSAFKGLILCGDAWQYIWRKGGTFVVVICLENINKTKHLVCILLGTSPASNCGLPTFRNPLSVPSSRAGCKVWIYIQPLKMELIEGSETSENHNRTPGKYPKEYIQDSKHGESLKSRKQNMLQWPWLVIRMDKNAVDQARTQGRWKGGVQPFPTSKFNKKKKKTDFFGYDIKVLRDLLVGENNHWNRLDDYYIRILKNKIKNLATCRHSF